ncbi:MAG: hypothetical protein J6W58_01385 [Lachnospiraceae bacterium]|nr:hypothetical protein [Lachnospiraceae bacterium]MBP5414343.1 hypothetical protein [Lachnospiraceae bacterium]MBP5744936.1 hypothetical protein [Lachnospiraceae bacterium]
METLILIIAIIVAAISVYWYIRLMTKDNKSKKEIWLALLCFWGAFISVAIAYVIIAGRIGPQQ